MFEARSSPLLSKVKYKRRLLNFLTFGMIVIFISLGIGTIGYHFIAAFSWIDALLNAAMILTGMGPVNPLITDAAKIWATVYALFSGIAFLSSIGIIFTPIAHRFLHKFHLEGSER